MADSSETPKTDYWRNRRRVLHTSLATCVIMCIYAIERADESVAVEMINTAGFVVMAVIPTYIFGAAWERVNGRDRDS